MKKMLLFAMALVLAFSACSKEDVPLYDGNANFIQFADANTDTVMFSFMFHPTVEANGEYELAIPVKILGLARDNDRAYKVSIIETMPTEVDVVVFDSINPETMDSVFRTEKQTINVPATTAEEGKHFVMPENPVFRAGLYDDTLRVKLYRTADLQDVKVRLGIRIENNDEFFAGQPEYRECYVYIMDMLTRPAWWTYYAEEGYESVQMVFLGDYSDKKYALLIEVTGVSDWTDLSYDERRMLALQFKRYLSAQKAAGNTIYEDTEGAEPEEMTVEVLG